MVIYAVCKEYLNDYAHSHYEIMEHHLYSKEEYAKIAYNKLNTLKSNSCISYFIKELDVEE